MSARLMRYTPGTVAPLSRNFKHQHALDYTVSLYARNAIFSFIPKNGCTSLRYSAALENQVISGLDELAWIHANNAAFRPTHRDLATAAYTFVVLRCPFRRLVSCFLHKIVDEPASAPWPHLMAATPQGALWSGPVGSWLAKLMPNAGPDRAAMARITFADFVSLLERPGALEREIHWRPQVDFLVYRAYDDVFRLEDMPTCVATVAAKTGFQVHDIRAQTLHGNFARERIHAGYFGRTEVQTLRKLKDDMKVPAYESFYDADLYRRVSRLYQADIALYAGQFGASALMQLH